MARKKMVVYDNPTLFELPESKSPEPSVKAIANPIWTGSKAKLIERYLYYFVLITKHGTYIDAFAGPQEPDSLDMWSARLVLNTKPRWIRHLHLIDANRKQYDRLVDLKGQQPVRDEGGGKIKRVVNVYHGDCNVIIPEILSAGSIRQKEATFCLLDQRTFECKWATVEAVAAYKKSGFNKIEQFYFLPNSWQDRALAAQKDVKVVKDWWGRDDWAELRAMGTHGRLDAIVERFKKDLGYKSVKPWPILEHPHSGRIMYYMIHATDHDEAPGLMSRAYANAVKPIEPFEQLSLLLM